MSENQVQVSPRQAEFEEQRKKVRAAVNNVYDIQKLRISLGNRISQSFMQQAGVKPGMKLEEMDKEMDKTLKRTLKEFNRVTDVYITIFENKGRIEKAIQHLGEELFLIQSSNDYAMIRQYSSLLNEEKNSIKIVESYVKEHPMWDAFFRDVVGCGPLMSAVCISYLDPYKARHMSSFHKYAGLDVVWEEIERKPKPEKSKEDETDLDPTKSAELSEAECTDEELYYLTEVVDVTYKDDTPAERFECISWRIDDFTETHGTKVLVMETGVNRLVRRDMDNVESFETSPMEEKVPAPVGKLVGRSRRHTAEYTYIDKKTGETKTKRGLTFQPFLKTKLVGVLADSFIKCPGCHYEQIYRGYRNRLNNNPAYEGYTDLHKHRMAKRFCIKIFLSDMWTKWREIEGLPVTPPYEVQYLGMNPHGFNFDETETTEAKEA